MEIQVWDLALAAVVKGYKCIFVTTDKQSKEKADILKAVGAEVIVCPTNVATGRSQRAIIAWLQDWQKKFPTPII